MSKEELSKDEKLEFLSRIIDGEDYTTNYQPVLEDFLDDPDPEVRALAISGLWDYPDPALIDCLFDKVRSDPSQAVRSKAIVVLGRYVYEGDMADYDFDWGPMDELMRQDELPREDFLRVCEFLLGIASDEKEDLDSRRFAIEALSFLADPEVLTLIEKAYNDPSLIMKVSALFAMGRNGHERWGPYILKELYSSVPELQCEAVRAAGEAYLEEATPRLLELARQTKDRNLRLEAIWAMGKAGGEGAYEFLEDLQDDLTEDQEIRDIARTALDELLMFGGLEEDEDWDEEGEEDWDEEGEEDWDNGNGAGREEEW
jgi:HEAT repeat protein